MGIIYFIVLLSVIVFIHELGHFLAAKAFNVYVGEFAIGMGPKLLKYQGKETLYTIRAIPLGGFCQMAGEAETAIEGKCDDSEIGFERSIKGVNKLKQIIIMLAGIFMNFLFAWILFSYVFISTGYDQMIDIPQVGSIAENSPADIAGLKVNDEIISVEYSDGTILYPETFTDLSKYDNIKDEDSLIYTVMSDGASKTVNIAPKYDEASGRYLIGISPSYEHFEMGFIDGIKSGASQLIYTTELMFDAFGDLFKGKNLDQLSGPVGIYTITKQQAEQGLEEYIWLIAVLSLNIGIFNALPLPILDGGRVVLVLYEVLFRRPVNQKIEQGLMVGAMVMLLGLMIFATGQDILRMLG